MNFALVIFAAILCVTTASDGPEPHHLKKCKVADSGNVEPSTETPVLPAEASTSYDNYIEYDFYDESSPPAEAENCESTPIEESTTSSDTAAPVDDSTPEAATEAPLTTTEELTIAHTTTPMPTTTEYDDGCLGMSGKKVNIIADNGNYLTRCNQCARYPDQISVSGQAGDETAVFTLITAGNKCGIQADNGNYLTRCKRCWVLGKYENPVTVHATNTKAAYSQWTFEKIGDLYSIKADTNKYMGRCNKCAPQGTKDDYAFLYMDTPTDTALWSIKIVADKPVDAAPVDYSTPKAATEAPLTTTEELTATPTPATTPAPTTTTVYDGCLGMSGQKVNIIADNGKYLQRCNQCGKTFHIKDQASVTGQAGDETAVFTLKTSGKKCGIQADNGNYLTRCNNCWVCGKYINSLTVHATNTKAAYSQWTFEKIGDLYSIKTDSNKYMGRCNKCAPQGTKDDYAFLYMDTPTDTALWSIKIVADKPVDAAPVDYSTPKAATEAPLTTTEVPLTTTEELTTTPTPTTTPAPTTTVYDGCLGMSGQKVNIIADNGKYLQRCNQCGKTHYAKDQASVTGQAGDKTAVFTLKTSGKKCGIQADNGNYLTRCKSCWVLGGKYENSVTVHATNTKAAYSQWTFKKIGDLYSIKTDANKYMGRCNKCARKGTKDDYAFLYMDTPTDTALWSIKIVADEPVNAAPVDYSTPKAATKAATEAPLTTTEVPLTTTEELTTTPTPTTTPAPTTTVYDGCLGMSGQKVNIIADNGKYLQRCNQCGETHYAEDQASVTGQAGDKTAVFTLKTAGKKCGIQADNGNYLTRCKSCWVLGEKYKNSVTVHATNTKAAYSQWTFKKIGDLYSIKTDANKYMGRCNKCARKGTKDDYAFLYMDTPTDTALWSIKIVADEPVDAAPVDYSTPKAATETSLTTTEVPLTTTEELRIRLRHRIVVN